MMSHHHLVGQKKKKDGQIWKADSCKLGGGRQWGVGLIECVQIRAPWYLVRCRGRLALELGITHGSSGIRIGIGYMVRYPCSHAEQM